MPYKNKAEKYRDDPVFRAKILGQNRAWRRKSGHNSSISTRRIKYGLSHDSYLEMVSSRSGLCHACGGPPDRKHPRDAELTLEVDHDHMTGAVRGLLCGPCNRTLGQAKDSVHRLRLLADYLERVLYLRLEKTDVSNQGL